MEATEQLIQVWIRPCTVTGDEKWERWPDRTASSELALLAQDISNVMFNDSNVRYVVETMQNSPRGSVITLAQVKGKMIKLAYATNKEFWIHFV